MAEPDIWAGAEDRYAWICHACGRRTPRGPLAAHAVGCPNAWPLPVQADYRPYLLAYRAVAGTVRRGR